MIRFRSIHLTLLALGALVSISSVQAGLLRNQDITCIIQQRDIMLDPDEYGQYTQEQWDFWEYSENEWICEDVVDGQLYSIIGSKRDEKMFNKAGLTIEAGVIVALKAVDLLIPSDYPKTMPTLKIKGNSGVSVVNDSGNRRRLHAAQTIVQEGEVLVIRVHDSARVGPAESAQQLADDLFCSSGLSFSQQECVSKQLGYCSGGQYTIKKTSLDTDDGVNDGVVDIFLPNTWASYLQNSKCNSGLESIINTARNTKLKTEWGWTDAEINSRKIDTR